MTKKPPRITYDAPSKTFERLLKEDTLEGMNDVIRKKLGVATSVPIYVSQVRDGKSIVLEDDDDFEAFCDFARENQVAKVKVDVGSANEDSEILSPSVKKKKRKHNATASSSDLPAKKKRRVSFVEYPEDQPEQSAAVVPATTPDKKKRKYVTDSSEPGNEAPFDSSLLSSPGVANEHTEKKKKKKKKPAAASEELALNHTENDTSQPETIPETPSIKKTKKRAREEDTSEIVSSSQPQEMDPLADKEGDTSRPGKKSKKKREQTVDEPAPAQRSRSKSDPPSSRQTMTFPSVEPETSIKSKKTQKKGKDRGVSEPPSAAAPSLPELRHDKALNEKNRKGKSKGKVDEPSSVDPPTTTEVKKKRAHLAQHKETPPIDSATLNQTTKKKAKAAEIPLSTLPSNDKDRDEPASPPKRSKSSKSKTPLEKSHNLDDPEEREKQKAATIEAIQAVLARKGITTSATFQALQTPALQAATSPAPSEGEEELPVQEEETLQPCPLCDALPTHDRLLCPVIKGGMRAMRKRLAQLEKDTSGDETKQDERQQAIAELQAMIQKRSRKPKTSNAANGSVQVEKAAVKQNEDRLPTPPVPIAAATKTAKQVDAVSPPTRVVDVIPPIASSQSIKSIPPIAKSLKLTKQPPTLKPPPTSQQPSTSQKSITKAAQNKTTTEVVMANLPFSDPSSFGLKYLPFEDLSQVTDKDLQSIIQGPKVSIADVPSSDGDENEEEEEGEEEPFLDEEEPPQKTPRRLSQGSTREYPSSSEAEEEDENSTESFSKAKGSAITEEEDQCDDRQTSVGPCEGDTSFREVDTRGSSREIDKTGDDAFDASLAEDFAASDALLPINEKPKTTEGDSDTAVGSQVEEPVDLHAKEVESMEAVTTPDPIEPSQEPSDERAELIASDDDYPPLQPTPKVESIIRTRGQKKKIAGQQESVIQTPKAGKKARKITELPVPSLSSARVIKPSSTSNTSSRRIKAAVQQDQADVNDGPPKSSTNEKVGSASIKGTKRSVNTNSKPMTSETSKGKASTKAGSRVSAANGAVSKTKSTYKITPTEPMGLAEAINRASGAGSNIFGSQWAVLQESNPLTETPGQVDELVSDFATPALASKQNWAAGASQERLFLPSESQTPFPYSQYSQIFASQRKNGTHEPSHESDDEEEVLATVVKAAKPIRTYPSLSQIASSQTFATPRFQPADFERRSKEPESLYGRGRHGMESESESSPESDADEDRSVVSHIPASRRAGVLNK